MTITGEARRLLLVDDNQLICLTLSALLEDEGYTVDTANSSSETEKLLGCNYYAAVLLDLNLGEENGLDLVPLVRRSSSKTKIVVISGDSISLDNTNVTVDAAIIGSTRIRVG